MLAITRAVPGIFDGGGGGGVGGRGQTCLKVENALPW